MRYSLIHGVIVDAGLERRHNGVIHYRVADRIAILHWLNERELGYPVPNRLKRLQEKRNEFFGSIPATDNVRANGGSRPEARGASTARAGKTRAATKSKNKARP